MIYLALLRGVNVGGKVLKMELLRQSLETLGFKEIETYIQSGNVIFEAAKQSNEKLEKKIQDHILKVFILEVPVIVRTTEELKTIIAKNPFAKLKNVQPKNIHVTFLSGIPNKPDVEKIEKYRTGKEQIHNIGSQLYLCCPNGYGNSKLSPANLERCLNLVTTTRNWNTVQILQEKLNERQRYRN